MNAFHVNIWIESEAAQLGASFTDATRCLARSTPHVGIFIERVVPSSLSYIDPCRSPSCLLRHRRRSKSTCTRAPLSRSSASRGTLGLGLGDSLANASANANTFNRNRAVSIGGPEPPPSPSPRPLQLPLQLLRRSRERSRLTLHAFVRALASRVARLSEAVRGAVEPLLASANGDVPRRRGRPRSPRSSSPASQTQRACHRHRSSGAAAANSSPTAGPGTRSSCSSSSASVSDLQSQSQSSCSLANGSGSPHGPSVEPAEQHAEHKSDAGRSTSRARDASKGTRWTAVTRVVHKVLNSHGGGFGLLFFIFTCYLLALVGVYLVFPEMRSDERQVFHLPTSLEDARALGIVLHRYSDRYLFTVTTGFTLTYIFLQSFAIPGSIFLSIVSGFLFSFPKALFLVCFCSAVGASNCYLLSHLTGRRLVRYYFPKKLAEYSLLVNSHRDHLLWYVIFLRVTPIIPNWVINIISPVVDVPMWIFFVATFIGVAPPSCIAIESGQTLNELAHADGGGVGFTWAKALFICFTAALSLLPILLQRLLSKRFAVVASASASAAAAASSAAPGDVPPTRHEHSEHS